MNKVVLWVVFGCLITGCSVIANYFNGEQEMANQDSIGQATMEADGTVVLQLRAESADGAVGDGYFSYPPSDANYDSILEHIGGLKPGETKPVPPWPDN